MIDLYTDGACRGNPGLGGYAAILHYKGVFKELTAAFRKTTNNRMELLAVIAGLAALTKPAQHITIYTDSRYIVNAIEKGWLKNWLKKAFKGKKNPDLWQRFYQLYQKHQITLQWVKGHAGNLLNERCDKLAVQAALTGPWQIDTYYETQATNK